MVYRYKGYKYFNKNRYQGQKKSGTGYSKYYRSLNRRLNNIDKRTKPELKYHDRTETTQSIDNTENIYTLTLIAAGDTENQREGTQIRAKRLRIRLVSQLLPAATESAYLRILVVQWHSMPDSGSTPGIMNVLTNTDYNALWNMDSIKAGKLTIMKDLTISLDPNDGETTKYYSLDINCKNKKINYRGVAGTTANASNGQIALYAISDIPAASDPPEIEFRSRLLFTE